MRSSELDLIFAPDLSGAPSDLWQARWAAKLSTGRCLELDPGVEDHETWIASVARAASGARRPVVFVAHSVGALAVAHAASRLRSLDVRGAFLVAPPADAALRMLLMNPWPETPRDRLPWPSVLVASRTDPWASPEQSRELAEAWGSTLVDAGEVGRLDAESGHGPWPDGLLRLAGFLKQL
jgi:predicted alpha/beta hydrolase family esterase